MPAWPFITESSVEALHMAIVCLLSKVVIVLIHATFHSPLVQSLLMNSLSLSVFNLAGKRAASRSLSGSSRGPGSPL